MDKYDVYKVFTPTTPARLAFVEREKVNLKLVSALRTPGKQVVVYGHSGSGKTTLLVNKLHQLYEHHLTSRCMKGLKFEALIVDAFDQLAPYYLSEQTSASKSTLTVQLSQEYFSIKSQLGASNTQEEGVKSIRILPPQLTPQALGRFIGQVNSCWVLEDFHKIDESERAKLSQIMKVFMDMADEYPSLKVIAIGAVDTARQVVEYDGEMKNRVAEIHVPLMDNVEVEEIIKTGSGLMKIRFDNDLIEGIGSYSNGMAAVCHHLCLNICSTQGIYETQEDIIDIDFSALQDALNIYLEETSDTLKRAFDIAFRQERTRTYDNNKLIIKALSELNQDGSLRNEILEKIRNVEPNYPQGNLTRFLDLLCDGKEVSIIRYDSISGRYSFSDPIYRVFALTYFRDNIPKKYGQKKNKDDIDFIFEDFKTNIHANLVERLFKSFKL